MDTDGYIITEIIEVDEYGVRTRNVIPGLNQYNNPTGQWVDYHPGEEKLYDCGRCHRTGWIQDEGAETDGDLSDNQDGLPGIWGTFAFGGIQCEQCHCPSAHFGDAFVPGDGPGEACGECHRDKNFNWLAGQAKNFHQRRSGEAGRAMRTR